MAEADCELLSLCSLAHRYLTDEALVSELFVSMSSYRVWRVLCLDKAGQQVTDLSVCPDICLAR